MKFSLVFPVVEVVPRSEDGNYTFDEGREADVKCIAATSTGSSVRMVLTHINTTGQAQILTSKQVVLVSLQF